MKLIIYVNYTYIFSRWKQIFLLWILKLISIRVTHSMKESDKTTDDIMKSTEWPLIHPDMNPLD
jgi:hypothetical protein